MLWGAFHRIAGDKNIAVMVVNSDFAGLYRAPD